VQENVIAHTKAYVGNPQVFREKTGEKRLLLAVIAPGPGTSQVHKQSIVACDFDTDRLLGAYNRVYAATSADGPWVAIEIQGVYNNPTLVPRPDGSIVMFCHDCAHKGQYNGWGASATGVMGEPTAGGLNYTWKEWAPPATGQDGGEYKTHKHSSTAACDLQVGNDRLRRDCRPDPAG